MTNRNITILGHLTKDIIKHDGKVVQELPGGTVYYSTTVLQQLGESVMLVTKCASDGRRFLKPFEKKGAKLLVLPSKHTTVFINDYLKNNPDERKESVGTLAGSFTEDELKNLKLDVLYLGMITAGEVDLEILEWLVESAEITILDVQGLFRSVEAGVLRHSLPDGLQKAVKGIHILKANSLEARFLTNKHDLQDAIKCMYDWGVGEVVVTCGSEGSLVYDGQNIHQIPSCRYGKFVDATGCGDTYLAAYLSQRLKGQAIPEAGKFAAMLAGKKTEVMGALDLSE
jgi:sugar/nucleoside kinase (ribokinase family)